MGRVTVTRCRNRKLSIKTPSALCTKYSVFGTLYSLVLRTYSIAGISVEPGHLAPSTAAQVESGMLWRHDDLHGDAQQGRIR